jgi:hypothetical protein
VLRWDRSEHEGQGAVEGGVEAGAAFLREGRDASAGRYFDGLENVRGEGGEDDEYARYVRLLELRWALAVAAWFVAGLLAKPMVVTLPFVLLLLDYWSFGRLSAATVREKLPLVVLAAAASAVTFVAQRTGGALHAGTAISLGDRVANAIVAYKAILQRPPPSFAPRSR